MAMEIHPFDIDTLSKREWQELRLILQNTSFQKEVQEIRSRRGITPELSKKIKTRWETLSRQREALRHRERKKIQRARREAIEATYGEASHVWFEYSNQVRSEEIRRLGQIVGLPHTWDMALKHYVYFGVVGEVPPPIRALPIVTPRTTNWGRRLFIEVFKTTGVKDVEKIWPLVQKYQALLLGRGRFRIKSNFGRDIAVFKKGLRGKGGRKISEEMDFNIHPDSYRAVLYRLKKRLH